MTTSVIPSEGAARSGAPQSRDLSLAPADQKGPSAVALASASARLGMTEGQVAAAAFPQGHEADPPYMPALLSKVAAALDDMQSCWLTSPLGRATFLTECLLAHGLGLVELDRARCWVDERVYAGALFRLRLAEHPPSLTVRVQLR